MMQQVQVENFRLRFALAYAAIGWQVFPLHSVRTGPNASTCTCGNQDCGNVAKHPRTASGLKDATVDAQQIKDWWNTWPGANVGIVAGAASGFFVIDVDPRHGGDKTLAALMSEHGELPETTEAETGGGGRHILFVHPGWNVKPDSRGKKLGDGVDIRGDGSYIVAPPSQHKSLNRYTWAPGASPRECKLSVAPSWILDRLKESPQPAPRIIEPSRSDIARLWLGKALARVREGTRNDDGLWLACQLRDAGLSEMEARPVMIDYVHRCPAGTGNYTEIEAIRTLSSAYSKSARQPARNDKPYQYRQQQQPVAEQPTSTSSTVAGSKLRTHLEDVIAGRVFNAPWPWDLLTRLTQALTPGAISVVCGDPGVGKTYFVLQCLQFWVGSGFDASVFFIEKDLNFHTRRLLAQMEGDGSFVMFDWLKSNPDKVRDAMNRHEDLINLYCARIESRCATFVTLENLNKWIIEKCRAGSRIIAIDPISAAIAGVERWTRDHEFIASAEKVLVEHGASLVLITHPKQAAAGRQSSGHAMGGGAAYFRFSDVTMWIKRTKKPRNVWYQCQHGRTSDRLSIFIDLLKTRDGKGSGTELAYAFTPGLKFQEKGIVLNDVDDSQGEGEAA
jgi:KaiC/GvpD/RAD55 family RecA-like ATPase